MEPSCHHAVPLVLRPFPVFHCPADRFVSFFRVPILRIIPSSVLSASLPPFFVVVASPAVRLFQCLRAGSGFPPTFSFLECPPQNALESNPCRHFQPPLLSALWFAPEISGAFHPAPSATVGKSPPAPLRRADGLHSAPFFHLIEGSLPFPACS